MNSSQRALHDSADHWILPSPDLVERFELRCGGVCGGGLVDRFEVLGYGPAIFPRHVFQAVTDQMHHTGLDPSVAVDRFDCFGQGGQTVATHHTDGVDAPVFDVVENHQPELRRLASFPDP